MIPEPLQKEGGNISGLQNWYLIPEFQCLKRLLMFWVMVAESCDFNVFKHHLKIAHPLVEPNVMLLNNLANR